MAARLALVDNQIFLTDRDAGEVAFEDFAGAGCVARLRRKRRARVCGVMPW